MAFCHDKDVRRELYMAYMTRGYPENEPVLRNLLRSRLKFAKLMGYDSWVDFATSDYMSGMLPSSGLSSRCCRPHFAHVSDIGLCACARQLVP